MTTTAPETKTGFAAEHDVPIPYMQRTRDYYRRSASARTAGPTSSTCRSRRCATPLDRARVALITTAAPFQPEVGDQGPGAPYNAAAKFYQVYSVPVDDRSPTCASRTSATTACTRRPRTSTPTCRWRA